jgi:4-hydroxy-tetrahydrodipicolinate synthase
MMQDERVRASGVISVMSNLVPAAMVEMVAAQAHGDSARALSLQEQLKPLFGLVGCAVPATRRLPSGREAQTVDKFRNPSPVKTMMAGLGMIPHGLRAPLGSMIQPAVARCRAGLVAVHSATPELLAPIEQAFSVSVGKRLADDEVWSALCR